MTRPTSAQEQEIEGVESDLAALSEADEAARILALRLREPHDIAEVKRIRQAIERVRTRAKQRRDRIRQHHHKEQHQ